MIIGSSHGVGGGPTQTEVLSTVVAQLEPIHATCMEEVNKNIDQIIHTQEVTGSSPAVSTKKFLIS